MNFLAHAYFSYEHPQILAGNMISDFVKGSQKNAFPKDVRQGIALHHLLDSFTDTHFAIREAKQIFRPHYRLYSGAIVDVLLDHYLASDEEIFPAGSLKSFARSTYQALDSQAAILPPRFTQIFGYMKAEDWLFGYSTVEGIERSLKGLVRRAAYLSDHLPAYNLFREHYDQLGEHYRTFIGDVKLFAKQHFEELSH